jgi:hypothetical protein
MKGSKGKKKLSISTIILLLAIGCMAFYSIGYASFSELMNSEGKIDIVVADSDLVITSISDPDLYKDAVITSKATYSNNVANFDIQLVKINSKVTYSITIKNNGSSNIRYDTTNLTTSNDDITYSLDGLDKSTILAPNEQLTFQVIINYTDDYKYSFPDSKLATMSLEFVFYSTLREYFEPIYGYITEDSSNVSDSKYGAPATITLTNDNSFAVYVDLINNNNFKIYDEDGEEKTYSLAANSTTTLKIYIKDEDDSVAVGTESIIYISAQAFDYDIIKTSLIDSITLYLEDKGKYKVLDSGYTETPDSVDYSSISTSTGGIYSTSGINGGKVFYYRGVVSNNYFSFAGLTWRILRIDENANIRLVLNSLLVDDSGSVITGKFKTSNSATSLDDAIERVRLINDLYDSSVNSPLYGSIDDTSTTTLRGWYNNNIAGTSYENYIVDSDFCMDVEGGTAVSSGTESSVYYFGPYQKVGADTALYDPTFDCPSSGIITEKIGLLTADEYIFAGGSFRKDNTSFFLNDSSISANYWTMSPGYYDSNQSKVGVFYVSSTGSISDWPNANTLTNSYGIRPVITVNGNNILNGDGTIDNPYTFG